MMLMQIFYKYLMSLSHLRLVSHKGEWAGGAKQKAGFVRLRPTANTN